MFGKFVFFFENPAFYEKMWKKIFAERGRQQMIIWRMLIPF